MVKVKQWTKTSCWHDLLNNFSMRKHLNANTGTSNSFLISYFNFFNLNFFKWQIHVFMKVSHNKCSAKSHWDWNKNQAKYVKLSIIHLLQSKLKWSWVGNNSQFWAWWWLKSNDTNSTHINNRYRKNYELFQLWP